MKRNILGVGAIGGVPCQRVTPDQLPDPIEQAPLAPRTTPPMDTDSGLPAVRKRMPARRAWKSPKTDLDLRAVAGWTERQLGAGQ